MDGKKASHAGGGGGGGGGSGIKHRLTQMLLRNACTISTSSTTTTTTSFVTVSKTGTNHQEIREDELHTGTGTPSLSMLLQKHRNEKEMKKPSTPRLEKSSSHRTAPVVQVSIDCGGGGRRTVNGTNNHVPVPSVPVVKRNTKTKKKKNNNSNSSSSNSYHSSKKTSPVSPSSSLTRHYYSSSTHETRRKKITGRSRNNNGIKKWQSNPNPNPYGFISTSSSAQSDMEPAGLFSSEGEEEGETETQTLFSSKSFSSDSSEVYHRTNEPKNPPPMQPKKTNNQSPNRTSKRDVEVKKHPISVSSKDTKAPNTGTGSFTGTSDTGNTGTTGTGRAVVKRSCNPYVDFRNSMVEMIVEQKVMRAKEMERLLQSYLALNATHHHPVIVRAFEDICEAIFTDE